MDEAIQCDAFSGFFYLAGRYLKRVKSELKTPTMNANKEQEMFWSAFWYELNRPISEPFTSWVERNDPHALGTNCARYEILIKHAAASGMQPSILKLPKTARPLESTGAKFIRTILGYQLSPFNVAETDYLYNAVVELVSIHVEKNKLIQRIKDTRALWKSIPDLWVEFYPIRRKREKDRVSGTKKTVEKKILRPGKPWELPTVMPFEKRAIKEVYGQPWEELNKVLYMVDEQGRQVPQPIPSSL